LPSWKSRESPEICGPKKCLILFPYLKSHIWTTLSQPPEIKVFGSTYFTQKILLSWPALFHWADLQVTVIVFVSLLLLKYIHRRFLCCSLCLRLRSVRSWAKNLDRRWNCFTILDWIFFSWRARANSLDFRR